MKKVLAVIATSGFLAAGLLVMPSVFAQATDQATVTTATATAPAATTPVPAGQKAKHHERHPELHKALRNLKSAKQDLEKAAHDFGGHKAAAIQAINQAIGELEAALHYDKKE